MTRLVTLRLVLVLGLVLPVVAAPVVGAAQEAGGATPESLASCESPNNLAYPNAKAEMVQVTEHPAQQTSNGLRAAPALTPFDVDFLETFAAIPPCWYPEQMVVEVVEGDFVLALGSEEITVVADPAGREIPIMDPVGQDPYYQESGRVVGDKTPCTTLCAIPADSAVLLAQGSRVYFPGQGVCLWCLLHGAKGKLRVYAAVPSGQSFSWTQLDFDPDKAPQSSGSADTMKLGWAFNPPTNCRGG